MQIELTEKNERWLKREASKWSATPTLLANQIIAKSIAESRPTFGMSIKNYEKEIARRTRKPFLPTPNER